MAGFSIWVTQCAEYDRISLHRILHISWVLNMPDSEYGRVPNQQSYTGF